MGPADMDEPDSEHGPPPGYTGPPVDGPVPPDGGPAEPASARPADPTPGPASTAPESAPTGPGPVPTAPDSAAGEAGTAAGEAGTAAGEVLAAGDTQTDEAGATAAAAAGPASGPAEPERPAPRPSRKKKILIWTTGGVVAVLLVAMGGAYAVYRHLNGNLHQVDVTGELGNQPVNLHPQAENIMLIGSDTRVGQGRGFGQGLTTAQSDTLMILHIAANRQWADVMSIPRDSWVNIPACKMGNGQLSSATTYKINEAFALGNLHGNHTDLGVACTIKTLEQDTGIHIDHFVSINFEGFQQMVNAVGGVEECNTTRIDDPKSGLYLPPGHHLLHGWVALAYVRARYTLGNGSDLERIGRQQAFLSSLVTKVKSKLLDPVAIYNFLDAATRSVTIDNQMGGIHGLYNLAMSVRSLPASHVTFFTLPTYPRQEVVPTDTANVLWTQPEDSRIFQDFRNDVPVSTGSLHPAPAPAISPGTVSVAVRNGTAQYGLQNTVASVLQQRGFKVASATQGRAQDVTETVIRYHAGSQAQARLLEAKVPGAAIQQVPGTGSRLTLVLGSNYGTTVQAAAHATPTPSPSISARTATQNICAN